MIARSAVLGRSSTLLCKEYQGEKRDKVKLNGTDKSFKLPYSNSKHPPWSFAFAKASVANAGWCHHAMMQHYGAKFVTRWADAFRRKTSGRMLRNDNDTNKGKHNRSAFNLNDDFNKIESGARKYVPQNRKSTWTKDVQTSF